MDKAMYDRGMAMRRKVLGDEYVDRAVANTDDFNRKFQDLLRLGPVDEMIVSHLITHWREYYDAGVVVKAFRPNPAV